MDVYTHHKERATGKESAKSFVYIGPQTVKALSPRTDLQSEASLCHSISKPEGDLDTKDNVPNGSRGLRE